MAVLRSLIIICTAYGNCVALDENGCYDDVKWMCSLCGLNIRFVSWIAAFHRDCRGRKGGGSKDAHSNASSSDSEDSDKTLRFYSTATCTAIGQDFIVVL